MDKEAQESIRGVLFDWDLTLARILGDVTRNDRLAALFQNNGFYCTPVEIEKAAQAYQEAVGQGTLPYISHPPQTQAEIVGYYLYILSDLGFENVTREQATTLYHAYGNLPTTLYDDTLPTLRRLKELGLQLGIISNHTLYARDIMERLVGDLVTPQHIVISDEVGLHKPSKTIFEQALTRVELPARSCIFVGDNLYVDAIGSVQKGGFRRGLWLDRNQTETELDLPRNVVRITSLRQVMDHLSF